MALPQEQATGTSVAPSDITVFRRIANIDACHTDVEERDYEKEMKRRWKDEYTARMRMLKVGHRVMHRDGRRDSNLDVYAILDAIGRVRLYFKPDDEPAKTIRICYFPDVVFDEPTTVEYEVLRPKLLYLRMQIDNLENTERTGYISRMEADLLSRSARCRWVATTIADAARFINENGTEPWPGWNDTMNAMSHAIDIVEQLQAKFKLPTIYYLRITAAIAARHLLMTWDMLPHWFMCNPCLIDYYIKMYDDFVTVKNTTVRRRNTLNYAAIMSGHPVEFSEAVFMKRYDATQKVVVKSREDLQALTAASIISGPVFEETLASLITEQR